MHSEQQSKTIRRVSFLKRKATFKKADEIYRIFDLTRVWYASDVTNNSA